MSNRRLAVKIILPLLILAVGVVMTVSLLNMKQVPKPEERAFEGPLVEVVAVASERHQVQVKGTGTVQSRYQSDVTPQVSGRVDWLSPKMVAGGHFAKGEALFTIETVDYLLALERAQANQAQAELELMRISSQAEIAREEWQRLQLQDGEEPNPLVIYEPQMKSAQAMLASAKAAVKQAELELGRTRVTAPFNSYVRDEQVDLGQYLRAGSKVGTLAGTDAVEIVVPLPLEELGWLEIPRSGETTAGSPATVSLELAAADVAWKGQIVRALGEVNPQNRMASVVVSVSDPYSQEQAIELLPGMFVEVSLHGRQLGEMIPLPRGAVRDGETAWVVGDDNLLKIRRIEIARRERDVVMVSQGLSSGDRVVLTGLAGAAEGMRLRPQLQEEQ